MVAAFMCHAASGLKKSLPGRKGSAIGTNMNGMNERMEKRLMDSWEPAVASMPMATPELEESLEVEVQSSENLPWMCIVWDDPVNLMSYVTYVFQTVLGYSKKRAVELMMQVHTEGKAVVSSGERDKVEADVKKLHTAGLWATMQQG